MYERDPVLYYYAFTEFAMILYYDGFLALKCCQFPSCHLSLTRRFGPFGAAPQRGKRAVVLFPY